MQGALKDDDVRRELLSSFDAVTGLPNRHQFLRDCAQGVITSDPSRCLVLITLTDARHYGEILRVLGHAFCEDFLRRAVETVSLALPQGQAIYHVSLLSIVFFAEIRQGECPPGVVKEIVSRLARPILCNTIPINGKVGVGLVCTENDGMDPGELLRVALSAAQDSRTKPEGWSWYNRSEDEAHLRAFRLLTDLPKALAASDQLRLNYQPRVRMADGRCVGAEALLRWNHPTLGAVAPGEFFPLVETTALITPITRWVTEAAAATLARMTRQQRDFRLSVNISPRNLEEPDFIDCLVKTLDRHHLQPEQMELEFTEGSLVGDSHDVAAQLRNLEKLGFDLAIGDFGSGYSNMGYISTMPARTLKIDRSLIRPIETDEKSRLLVRSIIGMGHALNYRVVAEGMETAGACNLLAHWGCDEGQGYHISRPLEEQAFNDWLPMRGATLS